MYPAFKDLLDQAYSSDFTVDSLLRAPSAGFPDFTVSRGPRIANWIEVKAPTVDIKPLPAPDAARFDRYRDALPHIVLTNGWHWLLYEGGVQSARVEVPSEWLTGAQALTSAEETRLQGFFERMAALRPQAARSYPEAVTLLATAARLIERAVLDMAEAGLPVALDQARASFTGLLQTNPADPTEISTPDFADALAQTCTFGYLLARVEAGHDVDPGTAINALNSTEHPFLRSTLYAVVAPDPDLETALRGVLRTACDAVNGAAPKLAGPHGDWEKVPYVYEQFFAEYRPEDRFKYGVFYTPEEITRFQVREIRRELLQGFGLSGLLDPAVRFLDPACGTGTYLLALAEEALTEAEEGGLPVASALRELFLDRVVGFDVSPGPASVAQARLTAWLKSHGVTLGTRFPVYTANTLTPPQAGTHAASANLWLQNINREQEASDTVKRDKPVLVVYGNPPWGDRPSKAFQIGPSPADNLIAEWAKGASGAVINLYDLYVAFWRFAANLLLERPHVQDPRGIVSYITNRSWLRGRAYSSMRFWLRNRALSADIVDLGGDIRAGARSDDEPVFAIKAGCAISTLTFGGSAAGTVRFRRLRGTRRDKLSSLNKGTLPKSVEVPGTGGDSFGPIDWGTLAEAPPITAFFAHNYPGVKTHRDELVIDVDHGALLARLTAWNATSGEERRRLFHESSTRTVTAGLAEPADPSDPSGGYTVEETYIVPHRYRPLDDRLLYADTRFIDRPGTISSYFAGGAKTPALVTMDTRTSAGPVVIATNTLPGYNSFRGSYETHVFPLALPPEETTLLAAGDEAILSTAALGWAKTLGASASDVGAYLLALGNAPSYSEAFAEALEAEIVRFPATTDASVFGDAVAVGQRLLGGLVLESDTARDLDAGRDRLASWCRHH